jgi:hypothetical protein
MSLRKGCQIKRKTDQQFQMQAFVGSGLEALAVFLACEAATAPAKASIPDTCGIPEKATPHETKLTSAG